VRRIAGGIDQAPGQHPPGHRSIPEYGRVPQALRIRPSKQAGLAVPRRGRRRLDRTGPATKWELLKSRLVTSLDSVKDELFFGMELFPNFDALD